MAVVQAGENNQFVDTPRQQPAAQASTAQSTIDQTDIGAFKLTDMFAQAAGQNGWVGEASDYLQAIRARLEDSSAPIRATMQQISDVAVAFSIGEKMSVVLVKEPDMVNLQALVQDINLINAREAFRTQMSGYKCLNIISVNRFMYSRPQQMASYITQTFMAETNDAIRDFNIDQFGSRFQVVIDSNFTNVRSFFDANSPSPVISGEFGFVASLIDKADPRNLQFQQPVQMFGVTGNVEFIRHDQDGTFRPVVHVTDILSVVNSTKILAIAIPLIADTFISRGLWRQQYTAIGKDASINIGHLIVDANQKPIRAENELEIKQMFNQWIKDPLLGIDVRAGHTSIPSLAMITRPSDHHMLIHDIFTFLNANPGNLDTVGKNMLKEITGVLESSRTGKFANYMDTRDLTYLYAVSKLQYSPALQYLLTRADVDPVKRFEKMCALFQELNPTHTSITTILDGKFVTDVANIAATKFSVNNPMINDIQFIDMNTFATDAYRPGIPVFGQSGGSSNMIGNGIFRF